MNFTLIRNQTALKSLINNFYTEAINRLIIPDALYTANFRVIIKIKFTDGTFASLTNILVVEASNPYG